MNDHLWEPSVHVDKSFTKIQAMVRPPPFRQCLYFGSFCSGHPSLSSQAFCAAHCPWSGCSRWSCWGWKRSNRRRAGWVWRAPTIGRSFTSISATISATMSTTAMSWWFVMWCLREADRMEIRKSVTDIRKDGLTDRNVWARDVWWRICHQIW